MKKFLSVFLDLVLLLPVSAFAVSDSDVVGCWAHYSVGTDGSPSMAMLYLAEDHVCYFIIQSFRHDEAGIGRTYVGNWKIQDNGSIYAKTGNNTDTELILYNESLALTRDTRDVYVNITPFTFK